jgi:hypothetical protein
MFIFTTIILSTRVTLLMFLGSYYKPPLAVEVLTGFAILTHTLLSWVTIPLIGIAYNL